MQMSTFQMAAANFTKIHSFEKAGQRKDSSIKRALFHRNRNESISLLSLAYGVIDKSLSFPMTQFLTCETGVPLYLTGTF